MIKIIVTLEEKDGRVSMLTNQPPTVATLKEMEAVKTFYACMARMPSIKPIEFEVKNPDLKSN